MIKESRLNIAGFTLIEILVALLIFAILSVITVVGLRSMIRSHHHLDKVDQQLQQVMSAMTVLRRDITQTITRPITSSTGTGLIPAFQSTSTTAFEFTRAGYTNPFMIAPRSTMQRVGYEFKNHKLIRITWPVLDRAPDTQPTQRVLLNHVDNMTINFVDDKGQQQESWSTQTNVQAIPRAVILMMHIKGMGELKGIFPIDGRGTYVAP